MRFQSHRAALVVLIAGLLAALPVSAQTYVMRFANDGLVSPVPANLAASSSTLAFGNVGTLQAKDMSFTMQNTGGAPAILTLSSLQAPFSLSGNNCGASLKGGASCDLTVRFNPGAAGAVAQTLGISAGSTSVSIGLTGTGQAQQYNVAPANNQDFYIPASATSQVLNFNLGDSGAYISYSLYRDNVLVFSSGCGPCGGQTGGLTAGNGLTAGHTYRFNLVTGRLNALTVSYQL